MSLQSLAQTTRRVEELESLLMETDKNVDTALNPQAVVDHARKRLEEESQDIRLTMKAFEAAYFPIQDRALGLVTIALYSFVLGFIFLAGGYMVWTFGA